MTNVGIAGLGFMGMIHYLAYQKVGAAKVHAMCETDAQRLAGDWRSIKGNFGPQGTMMDLEGINRYPDMGDFLADSDVEMVDLCLPPSMHADTAVRALEAGKHVLCEKPIALTAADADRMVAAAEKAGKLLMIGHVMPFFPEYQFAREVIASGKYGKLIGGNFKRIISDPLWVKGFFDPKSCGGPMIDLHIHDAQFIRLLCGMPRAVRSVGRMRGDVVGFFNSQFLFDDPDLVVTATSGVIDQQGRSFTHGYEIYLERATLTFDFAVIGDEPVMAMPVTMLTDDGKVTRPELGAGDPVDSFVAEVAEATKCVREQRPSDLLDGRLAPRRRGPCRKTDPSGQDWPNGRSGLTNHYNPQIR